jgi:hypothetical protein
VPENLVFVETFTIRPGRLDDFGRAAAEIVEFVAANEPQLLAYGIYVSEDGTEGTVLHVHPDYESVKRHGTVIAAVVGRLVELTETPTLEIYGPLAEHRLAQIRGAMQAFGSVSVMAKDLSAGFFR